MALSVGSRLGHYDVTALIGEGGWARSIWCGIRRAAQWSSRTPAMFRGGVRTGVAVRLPVVDQEAPVAAQLV